MIAAANSQRVLPRVAPPDLDEHRRSVRASVDKFNDTLDTKKYRCGLEKRLRKQTSAWLQIFKENMCTFV